MSPGEKRRRKAKREREQAAYEAAMAPLRAAGRSCLGCAHRKKSFAAGNKHICTLTSDFHGYTIIKLTDLCADWKERSPTPLTAET